METLMTKQIKRTLKKRAFERCASIHATLLLTGFASFTAISSTQAQPIEFGPFTLSGFAKVEATNVNNYCEDCQVFPDENKQRLWADEIIAGKPYNNKTNTLTLFQPYLAANFDLGRGWKASGLLSQRWRDGKEDIKGVLYERNVGISHEDYGSLRVGSMPTRSWSVADYPYGSNIGISDAWASSGAGYGLLKTRTVRYTSKRIDFSGGDLVLEGTYSKGNTFFKKNKPQFVELYAQWYNRDWVIDAILQEGKNGTPAAWGHGPFTSLTPFAEDDAKLGKSSQSIAMLMARYKYDPKLELYGGVRFNRWSGAYAVLTKTGTNGEADRWNEMFNVDWNGKLNGVSNPGYEATSTDFSLGATYKINDKWTASAGLNHLGKADTSNPVNSQSNPSERGQRNSATILTTGVEYNVGKGLRVYGSVGAIRYARKGLSPMSMPSNNAFTGVDSRISKSGNWITLGAVYTF
jgi:hypothetical protein